MKKTLAECIEQYKFYSSKYVDATTNHECKMIEYYYDKLCDLLVCAKSTYNVDLNDVDLSDIL